MNFNFLFSNITKDAISERITNKSVSIRMRITFLFLYLCTCFAFGQSKNNDISKNDNKNRIPIDSLIDISINIEEVVWQDSTKVVFFAITHHDGKYNMMYNFSSTIYYRNLGGPITVGRPFIDDCLIYPVFTNGKTSYFLLDDFNQIRDSLIRLSITVSTGSYDQSSSIIFEEYLHLQTNEIQLKLNDLRAYTSGILTNKDWYAMWIKNNPAYKDERILNIQNQCK